MTCEYIAYVSSGNVSSGNEVLRVTAEGEFIWNENADEMIASGDYSQYPALRHVLKALRENERLRDAVAAEREACAKVCEKQIKSYMSKQYTTDPLGGFRERFAAEQCAAAIRARGEV